jgi:hypothetical protein
MLLAALYGGLAVGQRIVAYRHRPATHSPSRCGSLPPRQQLVSAHRHHYRGPAAHIPECYRIPGQSPLQLDAYRVTGPSSSGPGRDAW